MQFRLSTLLLAFVVVATALGLFGRWGILVAAILLGAVAYIRKAKTVRRRILRMMIAAVLLAVPGFCCIVLVSKVSFMLANPPYSRCSIRLRHVGKALKDYQETNGSLPPAFLADKNGKPVHGWRALLVPFFLGDASPSVDYNFNQPWNGQTSKSLRYASDCGWFACPGDQAVQQSGMTSFVAVVGPNTAWPDATPWKVDHQREVPPEAQILLVEIADSQISWMEPRDLFLEEALRGVNPESGLGISSRHVMPGHFFFHDAPLGAHALFADGSVRVLPPNLPRETLEALLTVDAGTERKLAALQELEQWKPQRRIHWPNCCGLAVLLASVGVLLFRRRDVGPKADAIPLKETATIGDNNDSAKPGDSGSLPMMQSCASKVFATYGIISQLGKARWSVEISPGVTWPWTVSLRS